MGRVRTVRRRAAYLLGMLQLSFSIGLAANLVFCLDAHGQLAVEPAGICCTESLALAGPGLAESCGCIDTPLFRNRAESVSPARLEAAPPTLYALSPFPPTPFTAALAHGHTAHSPARSARSASSHRTVVLLL
jgi:hypothetical protein